MDFWPNLKSKLSHHTADDDLGEEGEKEDQDHNGGTVGHPLTQLAFS